MKRWFLGIGLILAFAFVGLQPADGQDKKKKPADAPPPTDSDTLQPGSFTGKLKTPPGTDGSFIVAVDYQYLVLKNPNQLPKNTNPAMQSLVKDQNRINQLQTQIANTTNAKKQGQLVQQLQNAMNSYQLHLTQAQLTPAQSPYMVKTDTKDVMFHAAEDMKVRFASPPQAFDDKGNVKKYTADELKELKGTGDDAKLPGYTGSVEKLTAGMPVKVTLIKYKPKKEDKKDADKKDADKKDADKKDADKKDADKKDADKKDADKKDDEKKDDKKDPEKKDDTPKTVVSLVLVLGDENSGTSTDDTKPPKKNKN